MCVVVKYPECELDFRQIVWSPKLTDHGLACLIYTDGKTEHTGIMRRERKLSLGLALDICHCRSALDLLFADLKFDQSSCIA